MNIIDDYLEYLHEKKALMAVAKKGAKVAKAGGDVAAKRIQQLKKIRLDKLKNSKRITDELPKMNVLDKVKQNKMVRDKVAKQSKLQNKAMNTMASLRHAHA